jgi:uncharacterized membrane protein YczE
MRDELKVTILEWEKLRIAYNVIIGVFGLWLSWGIRDEMGGIPSYAFGAILYGITANIGFSLGPFTELYAKILTATSLEKLRLPLFALGTLFSALVTAVVYWSTEFSLSSDTIFDIN